MTNVSTGAFFVVKRSFHVLTTHKHGHFASGLPQRPFFYPHQRTKLSSSAQAPPFRSSTKMLAWIGSPLLLVGGGLVYWHSDNLTGLQRALSFYSFAIPQYLEYRWLLWRQAPDPVWHEVDVRASQGALDKILDLQGFYIKCGQMAAANIGNAFPKVWQDTMQCLQDECPSQNYASYIVPLLKEQTIRNDTSLFDILRDVDPVPLGAASIGQVHRATLCDGDKSDDVVLKIRFPHVKKLLRGDVLTMISFCEVAQPVHVPALLQLEAQFKTEFDYRKEALQLNQVRDNLKVFKDKCIVPRPLLEYCTETVLVMEELQGTKLAVALRQDIERQAQMVGMSVDKFIEKHKVHTLSPLEFDSYIAWADVQRRIRNASKKLHNMTVGLVSSYQEYEDKSFLPLNHARLLDDLLEIHGHEVLVDGYFNGDPHPGNILLCRKPDGSPILGLIDYGQVKTLTKEQRHLMCRILIALDDDDREEVVRLVREAGYKSRDMSPKNLFMYAKVAYDDDSSDVLNGKHLQILMEELNAEDPVEQFPTQFLMVARMSIILRGLAHALSQSRSVAKSWRPIAEKVLKQDI